MINENRQLKEDLCNRTWKSAFTPICAAKNRIDTIKAQYKIEDYVKKMRGNERYGRLKVHLLSLNKRTLIELYLQKCYDYKMIEVTSIVPKFDFDQEVWGILSNNEVIHTRVNTFRVFADKEMEYYCKYDEDAQEYNIDEKNLFTTREAAEKESKKRKGK